MGIFSHIFRGKKKLPPANLGLLKADMHSHFIPGIDDGAENMEQSLQLIRGMANFGYQKLITTPHIMSDNYRNDETIIRSGLKLVKEQLAAQHIGIDLDASAEYYVDFEFASDVQTKSFMTFGDQYLLIEISYLNEPDSLSEVLFELQARGIKPILAHPERYPFWYRNFSHYQTLKDREVLFQININSLCGYYSPEAKMVAMKLIDENMVDFLGSDCHHLKHQEIMEKTLTEPYLHKLIDSGRLRNPELV